MCLTNYEGYTTDEGYVVKVDDLGNFPDKVKKELEKSPATQLDILYIRNSLHIQGESISALTKSVNVLASNLEIDCGNGEPKTRSMKDIVTEMYNQQGSRRDLFRVQGVFGRHRKGITIGFVLFLLSGIFFHNQFNAVFAWLSEHIILVFKAIIKFA